MSKARTRNARNTRWLYRQESTTFLFNSFANEERSMAYLRRLAKRVWKREAPEGRRMPTIRAGDGIRYAGQRMSYCMGFTDIVLARNQRTINVLLHELTHALGPCQHGPKFVKRYFPLLRKFAGYNAWFLQGVAAERNIAL